MDESSEGQFKMPIAAPKPPPKSTPKTVNTDDDKTATENIQEKEPSIQFKSPAEALKERSAPPLQYSEPEWSGLPPESPRYSIEELKNGTIVNEHKLTGQKI